MIDKDADYVHITTNNTIFGTKYVSLPDTAGVPLVADMSSNILSERMDISKFAVIYAGAQKNIGPAGLTVVIVRDDLLERFKEDCPTMLKWKTQADKDSLYNTPPTYSIYGHAGIPLAEKLGGITEVKSRTAIRPGCSMIIWTPRIFTAPL